MLGLPVCNECGLWIVDLITHECAKVASEPLPEMKPTSPDFASLAAETLDDPAWPYNLSDRFRAIYEQGLKDSNGQELVRRHQKALEYLRENAPLHARDVLERGFPASGDDSSIVPGMDPHELFSHLTHLFAEELSLPLPEPEVLSEAECLADPAIVRCRRALDEIALATHSLELRNRVVSPGYLISRVCQHAFMTEAVAKEVIKLVTWRQEGLF